MNINVNICFKNANIVERQHREAIVDGQGGGPGYRTASVGCRGGAKQTQITEERQFVDIWPWHERGNLHVPWVQI